MIVPAEKCKYMGMGKYMAPDGKTGSKFIHAIYNWYITIFTRYISHFNGSALVKERKCQSNNIK